MRDTRMSRGGRLRDWLLEGTNRAPQGPFESEEQVQEQGHTNSWWKVMCLTGVDYFSTLGYQPGIAALAAGALSPIATLVLVLLTLFGALPVYNRVASESPHGQGSILMLERLLPFWGGKLMVLALLGFATTDFVITITLSAADASAHLIENPFFKSALEGQQVLVTLVLVALLGVVFLRGFREAIGLAVGLVILYLLLNGVVVGRGVLEVIAHPEVFDHWRVALLAKSSNPLVLLGISLILFPKLALGLSGFETGVAVMPQVQGDASDSAAFPKGRTRNTRKLLTTAALIMSVFLLASSLATTLLIPAEAFNKGGEANGRALAFLAHQYFGDVFGTVYDFSTIAILWFAGASAMAALINLVPRYLPRYGMAPEWTQASRPLVLLFTVIAFLVTILFRADVDAQGGAYATGVLVLISSASLAVFLSARAHKERAASVAFAVITLIFFYTTVVNVIERPDGLKIALFFIFAIVVVSLVSRVLRSTELRVESIELDEAARLFLAEEAKGNIRIIANRKNAGDVLEYDGKEAEVRFDTHIPLEDPILFLEVTVDDASDFTDVVEIQGFQVGRHKILRARAASVPNAIAAILLYVRDRTSKIPHVYFGWTEGNPFLFAARFILFGEGDIAPVTREILRQAEHDPKRRPAVHVGG